MSDEEPSHTKRFYQNIMDLASLIHELIIICYDKGYKSVDPRIVKFGSVFLGTMDEVTIIDVFIKNSYMHWVKIHGRDESFFMDNAKDIFSKVPGSQHLDSFKVLMESKTATGENVIITEDRDALWDYFDSLIKICIKYIHQGRGPKVIDKDGKSTPVYTVKFYPEITNLHHMAKLWKIERDLKWYRDP